MSDTKTTAAVSEQEISLEDLLEAGVHFGHQVRRWNPQMAQYIYGARQGVHVIDLGASLEGLKNAMEFAEKIGSEGKTIVFVGTKKQAQDIVKTEATSVGASYMTERWIGGILTNWDEVYKNIKKLRKLKIQKEEGEFKKLTKKEQLFIDREIEGLTRSYGGVETLDKIPDAVFVSDAHRETISMKEANRMNVPVIAICDTNSDVRLVSYPIPGNDDAIKSLKILTSKVARAYGQGKMQFEKNKAKVAASQKKEE